MERAVGSAWVVRVIAVLPPGSPAELWVASGNPRAVRFYERNGFTPDGTTDDGSAFGGIAALRMLR